MTTIFLGLFALFSSTLAFSVSGPAPLTREQIERLSNWTLDDKQNIWELSGQFQGDIVLRGDESDLGRNGLIDTRYRWPNNELPYELDGAFNAQERQTIQTALQVYAQKTCVKVRPRTASDKDYVYVTGEQTGCWSYVGRSGGRQQLNLQRGNPGCIFTGTIQHEFLHALGFHHQQCATDRDNYVIINWQNIQSGMEHNFDKYSSSQITDFGISYDYGSVMHYGAYAFSKNGQKTIETKVPNVEIGQSRGLSDKDVAKLKLMYKC